MVCLCQRARARPCAQGGAAWCILLRAVESRTWMSLSPRPRQTVFARTGRSGMKRIGNGEPSTASPRMVTWAEKTPLCNERQHKE